MLPSFDFPTASTPTLPAELLALFSGDTAEGGLLPTIVSGPGLPPAFADLLAPVATPLLSAKVSPATAEVSPPLLLPAEVSPTPPPLRQRYASRLPANPESSPPPALPTTPEGLPVDPKSKGKSEPLPVARSASEPAAEAQPEPQLAPQTIALAAAISLRPVGDRISAASTPVNTPEQEESAASESEFNASDKIPHRAPKREMSGAPATRSLGEAAPQRFDANALQPNSAASAKTAPAQTPPVTPLVPSPVVVPASTKPTPTATTTPATTSAPTATVTPTAPVASPATATSSAPVASTPVALPPETTESLPTLPRQPALPIQPAQPVQAAQPAPAHSVVSLPPAAAAAATFAAPVPAPARPLTPASRSTPSGNPVASSATASPLIVAPVALATAATAAPTSFTPAAPVPAAPPVPAAQIAASVAQPSPRAAKLSGEDFLNADGKPLKDSKAGVGTTSATGAPSMSVAPAASFDHILREPAAVSSSWGREMVDRVSRVVETLASSPGRSEPVKIDVPVEGHAAVQVQVSLRAGQVHAIIRAATPELQHALQDAWQQFRASAAGESATPRSWAEPLFISPSPAAPAASTSNVAFTTTPASPAQADSSTAPLSERAADTRSGGDQHAAQDQARRDAFNPLPSFGSRIRAGTTTTAPLPAARPTASRLLSAHA